MARLRVIVGLTTAVLLGAGFVASLPVTAGPSTGSGDSVGLFDPATGQWHFRNPDGTTSEFYYGMPGDMPLLGDWDCDGVDTVAMFRPSNGYVYLRNSNTFGVADQDFFYGVGGDIPLAGDWDGDGCDTFAIYRFGEVYVRDSLGTGVADYSYYFGVPGDRPFAGDFDGDGTTTVGLYRQSTGLAYFRNSNTTGIADFQFHYGQPADQIVAGDWDGDGDETVGIFRPGQARFYLSNANEQRFADIEFGFGESSWQPVAGSSTHLEPTYFVREDGGSHIQCTGLTDAPYPGSGTNQPCAWDHPFRALPPAGSPRINGGDTLIVGTGSYQMGYGAPGAEACDTDDRWGCHMPPIPSGLNAGSPTRILGAGWGAGCPGPPELWGTEASGLVINLIGAQHVDVACLEVTDHSGCVDDHSGGLACDRSEPSFGPWASVGIRAEDSRGVLLRDLDIHGLADAGVRAGRLTDWTVERVRLAANGWVGWDGDIEGDDGNQGSMMFRDWRVEWNGCAETYPGGEPAGCWGQSAGGYGDGVGTGETGGHWIIEDSQFLYNTSDGLDLLYVRRPGSTVTIRRVVATGNAGDQIKTSGPTHIENTVAVSNCGYHQGQPFTHDVDPCRSGGSALAFNLRPANAVTVVNSTVTGEGDCLVIAECAEGSACLGTESVSLWNDIFLGNPEYGADDVTCLAWCPEELGNLFELHHDLILGVKDPPAPCPPDSSCAGSSPVLDATLGSFDARLWAGSPAIDAGTIDGAPIVDIERRVRDAVPDLGAFEYRLPEA